MLKKLLSLIAIMVLSTFVSARAQAITIHVEQGDTLSKISFVHKTTVAKIKMWNHLHTDIIHPGDVLTVSPEASYLVKNGDTLWDIARAHHIHVSQLMQRNTLNSDLIFPGQKLVIPNSTTKYTGIKKSTPSKIVTAKTVTRVKAASTTVPSSGKKITVIATAYTPSCAGCSGITATGMNVKANPYAKVIAVDPSVIPLGSKVYIEGLGVYTAADTGGAIKGHKIDVLMASRHAAIHFGRKQLKITILN